MFYYKILRFKEKLLKNRVWMISCSLTLLYSTMVAATGSSPPRSITEPSFLPKFGFSGFGNCQDGTKQWSQIQTSKPPGSSGTSQMLHPCFSTVHVSNTICNTSYFLYLLYQVHFTFGNYLKYRKTAWSHRHFKLLNYLWMRKPFTPLLLLLLYL